MSRLHAVAAWTSPTLLAALAWCVAAGAVDAPVLVVAAIAAPLAALLSAPPPPAGGTPGFVLLGASAALLLLWADVVTLAEAGARLGVARWQAATIVGALALLVTSSSAPERRRGPAVALGLGAIAIVVALLGAGARAAPWTAWARVASRPALLFGERGRAATDGVTFSRGAVLAFSEAHRLIALTPGVYRVVEAGDRSVTRDWPLVGGDVLTVRPGDRLIVMEARARLRFEPGRRVPGAAVSGAEWATPTARAQGAAVATAAGIAVTMLGGARALLTASAARGRLGVPPALLVFSLAATAWGVYAADAAPEVALAPAPAALLDPAALLLPPAAARVAAGVTIVALLALALAAAWARRESITRAAGARAHGAWTAAVTVAVVAAATWPVDPCRALAVALGAAAAVRGAPLAGAGADGPAATIGAVAGAAAFGALVMGVAPAPDAVAAWPALVAAPLAWAIARSARALRTSLAVCRR